MKIKITFLNKKFFFILKIFFIVLDKKNSNKKNINFLRQSSKDYICRLISISFILMKIFACLMKHML